MSIFTKTKLVVFVTRARCSKCQQVITTTSERDAALMNKHPQDGRWLCRTCTAKKVRQ